MKQRPKIERKKQRGARKQRSQMGGKKGREIEEDEELRGKKGETKKRKKEIEERGRSKRERERKKKEKQKEDKEKEKYLEMAMAATVAVEMVAGSSGFRLEEEEESKARVLDLGKCRRNVNTGLTGSVILRSGNLSDVLLQLQELLKGVNDADISSTKIDPSLLAAQIRQLAQELRALSLSNPVTILNGSSGSSGGYGSYVVPAAALGAMGYCYMWWKGWSFSDVMFVTKQNMANAVASVSKQLDNLSEALATTKRHLTKRLENLDWKLEEQKEISEQILKDVIDVKSDFSQIGFDLESIRELVNGLEGKLEHLESRQDMTNAGVWYLCQVAGGIKEGLNARLFQDVGLKLDAPKVTCEDNSLKGLQFLAESTELSAVEKPVTSAKTGDPNPIPVKNVSSVKTRIHRSYPVGLSLAHDILRAE